MLLHRCDDQLLRHEHIGRIKVAHQRCRIFHQIENLLQQFFIHVCRTASLFGQCLHLLQNHSLPSVLVYDDIALLQHIQIVLRAGDFQMIGAQITMSPRNIAGSNILNGKRHDFLAMQRYNPANGTGIAQFGKAPTHWFWEMNPAHQLGQKGRQCLCSGHTGSLFGGKDIHPAVYFLLIQVLHIHTLTAGKSQGSLCRIALCIISCFHSRPLGFFFQILLLIGKILYQQHNTARRTIGSYLIILNTLFLQLRFRHLFQLSQSRRHKFCRHFFQPNFQ